MWKGESLELSIANSFALGDNDFIHFSRNIYTDVQIQIHKIIHVGLLVIDVRDCYRKGRKCCVKSQKEEEVGAEAHNQLSCNDEIAITQ